MKSLPYFPPLASVLVVLMWLELTAFGQPAGGPQSNTNSVRATNTSSPAIIGHVVRGGSNVPIAKVNKEFLEGLAREDAFNRVVNPLLERITDGGESNNGFLEFLKDLNLRPKVFEATGDDSNDASLGVEFDYKKSLANKVIHENALNPIGLSLAVEAKGDVALEAENNPNDLIEANGSIHVFQGIGGVTPLFEATDAGSSEEKFLETQLKINALAGAGKKYKESPAYREMVRKFSEHMRPQFFYDLQAAGGLETDQEFKNLQYVFGGKLGFVFRDWRPQSDVGYFNILDYPFAAIRSLINKEEFRPSGRTFPSVVVGLDQVDPSENEARLAVDSDEDVYGRARVEIAFKTPIYNWKSDHLYFSAVYRHFHELGASRAIRNAGFDQFNYFVAKVDLPYHFNVSYSAGKLPLDRQTDHVYAFGWNLNF